MTITISWEYFLGIFVFLVGIAWYAGSRFSSIEVSIQWMKDAISELKVNSDNSNSSSPAFAAQSPINLTATGELWLVESGLKDYVDKNRGHLIGKCDEKKNTNPYEVQKHIFQMFDTLEFDSATDDALKKFAFQKGTTMAIVRRVGAIYCRNICLEEFGMDKEKIDAHDPTNVGSN